MSYTKSKISLFKSVRLFSQAILGFIDTDNYDTYKVKKFSNLLKLEYENYIPVLVLPQILTP